MPSTTLSAKSQLDAATFYGNADGAYPLTNLADPVFAKAWRYTPGVTSASGHTAKFLLKLAGPVRMSDLAMCRHNFSDGAQLRQRVSTARLDLDLTADNTFDPSITFGGGTNGTRFDETGTMVAATTPRYEHDCRYFENGFVYSEDLTQPAWTATGCIKYPDGQTVSFPVAQAGGGTGDLGQQIGTDALTNDTYEFKVLAKLLEGNGDFCFQVWVGNAYQQGTLQTVTANGGWQWITGTISVTGVVANNTHNAYIHKLTGSGTLKFRKFQMRRGVSNGRYTRTTTTQRYQRIGVITEGAATNALIRSAEFDNAAWTKSGATVSANTSTAPDGTTTMDTITAGSVGLSWFQDITQNGNSTRAASVFFRTSGSTMTSLDLNILFLTGGVSQSATCRFNPSTGAFVLSSTTGGATVAAAGVRRYKGGLYRAYLVAVGTDGLNTVVRTQFVNGTTGNVVLWGAQNEANFVTTHIPTTTATVTRSADTATLDTVTWVPYAWATGETTLYHETQVEDVGADQPRAGSYVLAGTSTNGIFSYVISGKPSVGATAYQEVFASGASTCKSTTTNITLGTVNRSAYRMRSGDMGFSINGAILSAATGSLTAAAPTVAAVNLMSTPAATAYLRRVTVWPVGRSNADLQAITTSGPGAIDYDSGWKDALQMTQYGALPANWGYDYNVIRAFTAHAAERVTVEIYDPAKTGTTDYFECGRLFSGSHVVQPQVAANWGLGDSWVDRSSKQAANDGRSFFGNLPKQRQVAFSFDELTRAEGDSLHEMMGTIGISGEALYLPDPSNEAECQRTGFVGNFEKLDPLTYPVYATKRLALQLTQKR